MGLDVGLRRFENFEETVRRVDAANEIAESFYHNYDRMSEKEKSEASQKAKEFYASQGLGDWGQALEPEVISVELPSKTNPDHLFKIGYWRSSYNGAGIDSVLSTALGSGATLAEMMDIDPNDYYVQPNWEEALERVKYVLDEYSALSEEPVVMYENFFGEVAARSTHEALEIYRKVSERGNRAFSWFTNIEGSFFLSDPPKVRALIPAKNGVFVIYDNDEESVRFYIEALKIVIETIEYVLAQPDKEKYYLSWSG